MHVFLCPGDVKLKRRIVFKKRNPGDSPTAEFENEQEAMDPWPRFEGSFEGEVWKKLMENGGINNSGGVSEYE